MRRALRIVRAVLEWRFIRGQCKTNAARRYGHTAELRDPALIDKKVQAVTVGNNRKAYGNRGIIGRCAFIKNRRFGPAYQGQGRIILHRVQAKITLAGNQRKVIVPVIGKSKQNARGGIRTETVQTEPGLDDLILIAAFRGLKPGNEVCFF